jgi:hypothetical protein
MSVLTALWFRGLHGWIDRPCRGKNTIAIIIIIIVSWLIIIKKFITVDIFINMINIIICILNIIIFIVIKSINVKDRRKLKKII